MVSEPTRLTKPRQLQTREQARVFDGHNPHDHEVQRNVGNQTELTGTNS
jgi:hypothetical protein